MKLFPTILISSLALMALAGCHAPLAPARLQATRVAPVQQRALRAPARREAIPSLEAGRAKAEQIAREHGADAVLTDAHHWSGRSFGYLFGSKSTSQRIWVSLDAATGEALNVSVQPWDPQSQEEPFFAPINGQEWLVNSDQALDLAVKNGFQNRNDAWLELSHWFSGERLKWMLIPESFEGPGFIIVAATGEIYPCEGIDGGYMCQGKRITRQMIQAKKAQLQRRSR